MCIWLFSSEGSGNDGTTIEPQPGPSRGTAVNTPSKCKRPRGIYILAVF